MTDLAIETLRAKLANLPARDQEFATSLLRQFDQRGSLSDRQWPYVTKLVEKAAAPAPVAAPVKADAGALFALFATAGENLKSPKLRFKVDQALVQFSPAKPGSKNPGQIYVKIDGEYAGKIAPDGEFRAAFDFRAQSASLAALVSSLSSDPLSVGADYGRTSLNCCFCNLTLTDARSKAVGYGKTCASNWGLPWGE